MSKYEYLSAMWFQILLVIYSKISLLTGYTLKI